MAVEQEKEAGSGEERPLGERVTRAHVDKSYDVFDAVMEGKPDPLDELGETREREPVAKEKAASPKGVKAAAKEGNAPAKKRGKAAPKKEADEESGDEAGDEEGDEDDFDGGDEEEGDEEEGEEGDDAKEEGKDAEGGEAGEEDSKEDEVADEGEGDDDEEVVDEVEAGDEDEEGHGEDEEADDTVESGVKEVDEAEDEEGVEGGKEGEEEGEEVDGEGDDVEEESEGEEGVEDEELEEEEDAGGGVVVEAPPKEAIKETLVAKAAEAAALDTQDAKEAESGLPLSFCGNEDLTRVLIGRKNSVFKKYGFEAALLVGKVDEDEKRGAEVYLDSLNPHVIFVCGARGSGKSYSLGVIAEELALKNPNVGTVVIDPVGVFWSMRYPNREEREVVGLGSYGLEPRGLNNLKVFIPEGIAKDTPKETYDATFSMQPSLLTSEDWSLTYGIDRFSPSGLLLEKALKKVELGYKNRDSKKIAGKRKAYAIEDIIQCLETDEELNSRDRGYKQDSIRALVSRFEAATGWGVFSDKGTPLSEISKENQLTVIDTSFLDDNVTALVIGILSRRILAARKISTRKEAAKKFKTAKAEELLELDIPPTWLFIDEAHTLIPSGNVKTPATSALVEYVKQGRRPGCSIVLATQQPSAIDTKVLSQLDIMVSNKLIFDDDIKAVYKRTPTIIPLRYKRANFLKTLPVGVGLVGDRREETSRAFVMRLRPRMSQHEGRDAETTERAVKLSDAEARKMVTDLILRQLQDDGKMLLKNAEILVENINHKYKANVSLDDVEEDLDKAKCEFDEEYVYAADYEEDEEAEEDGGGEGGEGEGEEAEGKEAGKTAVGTEEDSEEEEEFVDEETELLALPTRINEQQAVRLVDTRRKKKLLGLMGREERIEDLQLKYRTIWRVRFEAYNQRDEFAARECFIDAHSGEFLHAFNDKLVESRGLKDVFSLTKEEIELLAILSGKELSLQQVLKRTNIEESKAKRLLDQMHFRRLLGKVKRGNELHYWVTKKFDLPPSPTHELLESMKKLPLVRAEAVAKERETYTKEDVPDALKKLWGNVLVKKIDVLNRPVWVAELKEGGAKRTLTIDAFTGREL